MSTIYIGIRHNNDLIISELINIKILMNTCTKCCDHCFDLGILKDSVDSCFFYV